jgi:predicted kinase
LRTVHKSDGEALQSKAAAVERLQGTVRQLEEAVQKALAKVEREEAARKKVEEAAAEARQAGDQAMHAKQAELQQAQLHFERSKDEAQRLGAALAGATLVMRSPPRLLLSSALAPAQVPRQHR